MNSIVKKVLLGLFAALVLLQFYRPAKNQSNDQARHLATKYPVPADVKQLLAVACDDCHSNLTRYPWYAEVQPVGLWLTGHVNEGKKHFNISEFTRLRAAVQNHKMEELIEMVKEGEMPLKSYTWTHGDARLTQEQRVLLTNWASSIMDTLRANYPSDSLVLRRKG